MGKAILCGKVFIREYGKKFIMNSRRCTLGNSCFWKAVRIFQLTYTGPTQPGGCVERPFPPPPHFW